MSRWIWLGGAAIVLVGCMKEQAPANTGAMAQQRSAQAAMGQMANREQQLQGELSRQQQFNQQQQRQLQQLRSQVDQYRTMQASEQAPAGREFSVKLDQPINASSNAGQTISGHLVTPIYGASGVLVAAPGALLRARIDRVDQGDAPIVELSFIDIETVNGMHVPIHATVEEQQQSNRSFDAAPSAEGADYDAALYPKGSAPKAVGGGPPEETGGERPVVRNRPTSRVVKVSKGTTLNLVLTEPLSRTEAPSSGPSGTPSSGPSGTPSSGSTNMR